MATIMNDAAYMGFPLSIKRGNPAPVDTTAVWYNKTELETYATSGATAYVGQILTLIADGKAEAYMISNEAGTLVKLAQTTASGDLATDVANLQTQVSTLITKIGAAKDGNTAATGLYALIEAAKKQADKGVTDAATAQSAAEAAQSDIDALETVVGADDTAGLRKRIKDNETAITILKGNGEGSVSKAVSDAVSTLIDGAPDTFDTFKEIAAWITEHGKDATAMTTAISALEAILVGFGTGEGETGTVKKYVDDAIAALKIGDYAKAADLTALAGRVDTLEGKPAASITQEQIDAWTAKQDAGDFVEKSAYNTKVKALEDANAANATAIAGVKTTAEAAVVANTAITAGTATKITYDAKGLVTKGENLAVSDIPNLGISKIDGLQDALDGKQATLTFDGTYNAGTNKAATVKTVTDAIAAVISDGDDAAADNTIAGAKLYADSKASTAESNAKSYANSLVGDTSVIGRKVAALEGKVDVDSVSSAISTAKTEAITAAGAAADTKVAAAKTAILGEEGYKQTVKSAYELASQKTTMAEVENKGYAVKTEVDEAIKDAKSAGTTAQAAVAALDTKVGAVTEGKTVVQMISEAQSAATYNDAAVKADIKKNTDAIGVLNGSGTGSVKKIVDDAINKFSTDISDDNVVNSYKELIDWVATHGSEAATMASAITALQAIVDGIGDEGEKATVIAYVNDAIAALNIGDYAKSTDVENAYVKKNGTDRLMTADEGTKLSGIAKNAQVNKIESVKVNGTAQTIAADKSVDITVPIADDSSTKIVENKISIKAVSTDLLTQGVDVLILNGGTASDD